VSTIFTQEDRNAIFNYYRQKYGNAVKWQTILANVCDFKQHEQEIKNDPQLFLEWYGFLYYLAHIEGTIGLFGYTSKGIFHRIFTMFGRAFLEEAEVKDSPEGKELGMKWYKDNSAYFHTGNGDPDDVDIVDKNGILYDVKNNNPIFNKAHIAQNLLAYNYYSGQVGKFDVKTQKFIDIFATLASVKDIAKRYGLDELLFNYDSSEEDIERYLGLID